MSKINDLNLKNWKEYQIKIFGDVYKIRKTYDIDDSGGIGIYGYEVYNECGQFLRYFKGVETLIILKNCIKMSFYKA